MGTGFGVFRIRGQTHFVHERPAVQSYWRKHLGQEDDKDGLVGQCLVTGARGRLARIHEPKIKGVLGAQSSGATLVSFNFDAAESYGKEQSYNAPVGEDAAFHYANALNHLLRMGSRQRIQIGDATTVFWTAQPSPAEAVFGMVFQPLPEDEKQKKEVARTCSSGSPRRLHSRNWATRKPPSTYSAFRATRPGCRFASGTSAPSATCSQGSSDITRACRWKEKPLGSRSSKHPGHSGSNRPRAQDIPDVLGGA